MTSLRLSYIHEFKDRHGKTWRYFRKRGHRQRRLPGSAEFMEAYQAALADIPAPEIGASSSGEETLEPTR